jgi:hypothetical protein
MFPVRSQIALLFSRTKHRTERLKEREQFVCSTRLIDLSDIRERLDQRLQFHKSEATARVVVSTKVVQDSTDACIGVILLLLELLVAILTE